jgi:hypothetical protein
MHEELSNLHDSHRAAEEFADRLYDEYMHVAMKGSVEELQSARSAWRDAIDSLRDIEREMGGLD